MKSLFLLCIVMIACGCSAEKKMARADRQYLSTQIPVNFSEGASQFHYLMKNLPPGKFPKTWSPQTANYEWSNSEWWCSGFYPGSLLQLFSATRDSSLYREAMRMLDLLKKEQYNKGTHDLGFMMFCSFGQANRLNHSASYDSILLHSAQSLSTRFNDRVGCIRSWNSKAPDFLVIIDNMMNLELLFWATRLTGDSSFYRIAVTHANTTMKNHFRPDNSSYHVIDYNEQTGAVIEKRTAQGLSNESAWARGQAWGLYGFTVMYRETRDRKYLDQATRIADFMLSHPSLPADKVPLWDYNAPAGSLRDASAAAITASALLELETYEQPAKSNQYRRIAGQILKTLSSEEYRAKDGTNGGFLLKHGVGHLPNKTEVDVPLTYADYYFLEAMERWQHGYKKG